jgi:hypothetical protein
MPPGDLVLLIGVGSEEPAIELADQVRFAVIAESDAAEQRKWDILRE